MKSNISSNTRPTLGDKLHLLGDFINPGSDIFQRSRKLPALGGTAHTQTHNVTLRTCAMHHRRLDNLATYYEPSGQRPTVLVHATSSG